MWLPRCPSTELSQVLGTLIANRLPTREAREWHQALGEQRGGGAEEPESSETGETHSPPLLRSPAPSLPGWPIEAVLFVYPGKRTYGQGEVILWELKLMGAGADHGLFLELILPAMEAASTTLDPQWHRANRLWGRFDIQAVYAARGLRWEPVVNDGRLDLDYRASSTQWAEDLTFGQHERRRLQCLRWITPFDLGEMSEAPQAAPPPRSGNGVPASEAPTLPIILDALMSRMTVFLPGKRPALDDVWALVAPKEQTALWHALQQAQFALPRPALKPAPKGWPGRWIGLQTFGHIPQAILPYLELVSILHIGRQTHFGCGTFRLE